MIGLPRNWHKGKDAKDSLKRGGIPKRREDIK